MTKPRPRSHRPRTICRPAPPVPQRQTPAEEKPTAAEKVYAFTPGATYAVTVPVGWPLDMVLERGEQVRNIVGGDRAPAQKGQTPRWEVKEGAEGTGDALRSHVFVTVTAPGLTTGLMLTTTKRTYYVTCKSVQTTPTRVVRWTYAPPLPETPLRAKEPGLLPDPGTPMRYHVGYQLTSSTPAAPAWFLLPPPGYRAPSWTMARRSTLCIRKWRSLIPCRWSGSLVPTAHSS